MSSTDDHSLALYARQGNRDAFAEIVRRHQQAVFNAAYHMLGNVHDAEDAAQETFIRAFQFFDRFDSDRPLAPWIVRQFHPRYLGLASEINTYMDAHPNDAPNFISLYNEIYTAVKAEAPGTKIFVTFQWEDLNNRFGQNEPGHQLGKINWDEVEAFEPNLDLWAISSYPFAAFKSGADIPADYYTPLLTRTSKPLAVAEGGFTSKPVGQLTGSPEDQIAYLNAIHNQIGSRLAFWVYLILEDFNLDSYSNYMKSHGVNNADVNTLGMFASVGLANSDGTPKPGMELWDSFRTSK